MFSKHQIITKISFKCVVYLFKSELKSIFSLENLKLALNNSSFLSSNFRN